MLSNAKSSRAAPTDTNKLVVDFPNQLLSVIPSLPAALVKQVGQKWEALSVLQAQQRELSNLILQTIRAEGGELLLKTCLCLSAIPRKGFSSARYFCPVSVLSNIRASRRSPCTSLEDEKDFLTLPGSASNVNTRALSSCSRESPL